MGPGYTKRQKLLILTCIVTLSILGVYSHCSPANDSNARDMKRLPVVIDPTGIISAASAALIEGDEELKTEYALVLGVDRSYGSVGRTDTLMLVVFNQSERKIGVVSIPRDLWVDIPHIGPGRINKVYRVGETRLGEGSGMPLLKEVVEDLFEIKIDYTAAADFAGFKWAIDRLGGVPVDVSCPIEDCFWLGPEGTPCTPLSLDPGRQKLDGETALLFARSRHGRTDMDRARRQQAVLLGLWEQLSSFETLLMLPDLTFEMKNHIDTNVVLEDIPHIVDLAGSVRIDALHGAVLKPPAVTASLSPDGKFIFVPDKEKVRDRMTTLFDSPLPGAKTRPRCVEKDVALDWRAKRKKKDEELDAGVVYESDAGVEESISPRSK